MASSQLSPLNGPELMSHAFMRGEGQLRLRHRFFRIVRHRKNHQPDFELVFFGELVVALVMRRHAHDRARAIIHQDVVGDPDRHLLAAERIDGEAMRIHAMLFDLADVARFFRFPLLGDQLLHFLAQQLVVMGKVGDQRMLRRKLNRGRAENRIDARRKYADFRPGRPRISIELEIDQRAFAAPNPVALHGPNFLRPVLQACRDRGAVLPRTS